VRGSGGRPSEGSRLQLWEEVDREAGISSAMAADGAPAKYRRLIRPDALDLL
jgi:hypothetical protein